MSQLDRTRPIERFSLRVALFYKMRKGFEQNKDPVVTDKVFAMFKPIKN